MFGWLKPKRPEALLFKSNDAAFEYASKYMLRPLLKDATIFGQVLAKVSPQFGGLLKQQPKWRVRLATEHGVLQTDHCGSIADQLASDVDLKSSPIVEGDLVAVQVGSYDPKYAVDSEVQYFIIICKLKPELRTDTRVFAPDVAR
ncbi:hypothetical protein [Halomonas sp. AOP25-F1-15]|uniref:hypothetical protein n=1 Tax=Halomonas sp. AOP25-F1-15 TaxID=3457709 RepID=UPI004033203E